MEKQTAYTLLSRSFFMTFGMWAVWFCANAFLNGDVWAGMTVSKSALTAEYCEFNNVARFFHQRMNTYSNLAYFFFGLVILQVGLADRKNQDTQSKNRLEAFPLLSILLGICFIYLCFGSAFFHASLTYAGQRVDMNGTYALTLVLVSIALYHVFYTVRFTSTTERILVAFLAILVVLFLKIALLIPSGKLLPSLILTLLLLTAINYVQFRKERSGILAILSFILIVVAIVVRTMDVQKMGCNPYSCYQGHALWHLLTALSSVCTYAFFRLAGKTLIAV
ncbi:MAG: ceramidase domain-containing protein [Spirosomataceae bacterium]